MATNILVLACIFAVIIGVGAVLQRPRENRVGPSAALWTASPRLSLDECVERARASQRKARLSLERTRDERLRGEIAPVARIRRAKHGA